MKIYRFTILIFIIFTGLQLSCGQSKDVSNDGQKNIKISDKKIENLKNQANAFINAQLNKDINQIAKFIYTPNEVSGSMATDQIEAYRKRNAENIINQLKVMEFVGFRYGIKTEEPQEIIRVENRLFSIVPTTVIQSHTATTCESKRFWLGISQDNGENWGFFKGDSSFQKTFESYFSEASKKIKLPDIQDPTCS